MTEAEKEEEIEKEAVTEVTEAAGETGLKMMVRIEKEIRNRVSLEGMNTGKILKGFSLLEIWSGYL